MPGLWGCWCQVLARAAWQSDPGAPGGWRGLCCSLPPSVTPRGHVCGCPCAPTCSAGQDVLLQDPHQGAGEQQPCGAGLRRCRTCGVSPTGHWFWHKKQAGSCKTPSTWVQLLSPGAEGFLQCALLAGTLQEIGSFLTAVCAVGPVLP